MRRNAGAVCQSRILNKSSIVVNTTNTFRNARECTLCPMVGACDNAQQDGWTGFYSDPLDVKIDGRSRPHPVVADYGLDRSSLWGSRTPDDNAPSWCAFPGPNPSSWGARAYVLRPGSECFAPRKRWGDDHSYWVTPTHRLARDFAQWRLMGRTIRFTVDLHHVGCGAVLTLYLSALPAVNERYELNPQNTKDESVNNPGCASQMLPKPPPARRAAAATAARRRWCRRW